MTVYVMYMYMDVDINTIIRIKIKHHDLVHFILEILMSQYLRHAYT